MQVPNIWQANGAAVYSVAGGFFVVIDGRIIAVALPDSYDSAETHFRRPLQQRGITVLNYPTTEAEVLAVLGLEPKPKLVQGNLFEEINE